jgi:crossover junction endodeoxyribonuclease RuvC
VKILGIDPAMRNTGYGLIESNGQVHRFIECGVIKNSPKVSQTACLLKITEEFKEIILKHEPDEVAVEGIIFVQNFQTAIAMGAARAAALIACASCLLPIYEYAPRKIKASVTGMGQAGKGQVGFMIRALLKMSQTPPPDAADALAVALTHSMNQKGILKPLRIG